jgi:hypothetical protein
VAILSQFKDFFVLTKITIIKNYMRLIIINIAFFLTLFSSNICKAQYLNYNDIKYIYSNEIEKTDEYVTKRGFEFYLTEVAKDGNDEFTNWAYKRDNYNDEATTFIIKICHQAKCGFVWYQLNSIKHFNAIKDYCKKIGYKVVKTQADKIGYIDYIFSNKVYEIKFSSGVNSAGYNIYVISFSKI